MGADEYRYLTFLYYDLVNSTPMSQRLDEESWRSFLKDFIQISNRTIRQHGGELQGNRGDGAIAYFGFPATQRISAVQAVRAGLDLVNGSDSLYTTLNNTLLSNGLEPLSLRVGIHSGGVVVGDIDGRQTATGFALAFTERLHQCAEPNTVILGSATLELLGERFSVERVGERSLKGVDQPALCFRALSENDAGSADRSALTGREQELQWLHSQWQSIKTGAPRVALLTGEAGIGKTRLISEFRHAMDQVSMTRYTWRCLPEMSDKAWHPIAAALHKQLADPAIAALNDPIARLEALLPATLPRDKALPAMAHLLNVPLQSDQSVAFASAEARRQAYFDLLVDALALESGQQPVLLVVEDVQWIDSASLECLVRLCKRTDCGPFMLLLSQRTETSHTWSCPLPAHTLELGRLSHKAARSLVTSMSGGEKLNQQSLNRVLERSDGVPLFIEESAHLEIDHLLSETHGTSSDSNKGPLVPPRLIDLLTERLDRVGDARETAALAATIGRQFPLDLVERVSTLPEPTVRQHIRLLVDSGLLLQQAAKDGNDIGWFKHALVRDSAYGVLLDSHRRDHHQRIAQQLEAHGLEGQSVSDDVLAMHFNAAGKVDRAFELWMAAGLQARRNSEQFEAISHFRKAEALIPEIQEHDCPKRERQMLILHLASVRCHVALEGYSSDEACRHAKCAEALALECGSELEIANARYGICSWLFVRGRIEEALSIATECLHRSDHALAHIEAHCDASKRDPLILGVARASWACGNMEFHAGRFDQAMPRIERCITLCRSVSPVGRYMDQDPLIMCLCYRSWYEWESGDSDKAISTVLEAVSIARQNARAFTIALSLAFHAAIRLFRGEDAQAFSAACESISISEKSHYATWHAWALVFKGRARCHKPHERAEGIRDIEEGLRLWEVSAAIITRPFMLAQLAEAYLLDAQFERALGVISQAQQIVSEHGDRYYEAAICRTHGNIVQQMDNSDQAMRSAHEYLTQSMHLANQRKQYGSALRAAIDRCRPAACVNEYEDAVNDLRDALRHIKGGLDTLDPRLARQLIDTHRSAQSSEAVPEL